VLKLDEAGVLDTMRLRFGDRENHALTNILSAPKAYFYAFLGHTGNPMLQKRKRGQASGPINAYFAIRTDDARPKRQRRHMTFTDRAETQDEAALAGRHARLIWMGDNARIEQSGGFERILVHEVRANELTLRFGESDMAMERIFHFVSASLKGRQDVAVAALKINQNLGQLAASCLWIERQDSIHDVVRPRLVRRVLVARLGGRLELAQHYPRGVGAQGDRLTDHEFRLRQRSSARMHELTQSGPHCQMRRKRHVLVSDTR